MTDFEPRPQPFRFLPKPGDREQPGGNQETLHLYVICTRTKQGRKEAVASKVKTEVSEWVVGRSTCSTLLGGQGCPGNLGMLSLDVTSEAHEVAVVDQTGVQHSMA